MSSLGTFLFPTFGPATFPEQDTFEWLGNLSCWALHKGESFTVTSLAPYTTEKIDNLFWKILAYTFFLPLTLMGWAFYKLSGSYNPRIEWCRIHSVSLSPHPLRFQPFQRQTVVEPPNHNQEELISEPPPLSHPRTTSRTSPEKKIRELPLKEDLLEMEESLSDFTCSEFIKSFITEPEKLQDLSLKGLQDVASYLIKNKHNITLTQVLIYTKDRARFDKIAALCDLGNDLEYIALLEGLAHNNISNYQLERKIKYDDVASLQWSSMESYSQLCPIKRWKTLFNYSNDIRTLNRLKEKAFEALLDLLPDQPEKIEEFADEFPSIAQLAISKKNWGALSSLVAMSNEAKASSIASQLNLENKDAYIAFMLGLSYTGIGSLSLSQKLSKKDVKEIGKQLGSTKRNEYQQWRTLLNYADGEDSRALLRNNFISAVFTALPDRLDLTDEEVQECFSHAIANEDWDSAKDLLISLPSEEQFRELAAQINCQDDEAFLSLLVALSHMNITDFPLSRTMTPKDVNELSDRFSGDMSMSFPLIHWKKIAAYCHDEETKKAIYKHAAQFCINEPLNEYDDYLEEFSKEENNLPFLSNLESLALFKFTYFATQSKLDEMSSRHVMHLLFTQRLSHMNNREFKLLYYSLSQLKKPQDFSTCFEEWIERQFKEEEEEKDIIIKCYALSYAAKCLTPALVRKRVTNPDFQEWIKAAEHPHTKTTSKTPSPKKNVSSKLRPPIKMSKKRKKHTKTDIPSPHIPTADFPYKDYFVIQAIFDAIRSKEETPFSQTVKDWDVPRLCRYSKAYPGIHFAQEFLTYIFTKATLPFDLEVWNQCRSEIDKEVKLPADYLESLIPEATEIQKIWLRTALYEPASFSLSE